MKAEHLISIVTEVAEAMQAVLTDKADELARETGFIQRERKFRGSSFVQTLVFGWLSNGEARLRELSQSAANVRVNVSHQALDQRFTPEAAHFLEEVLKVSIAQVIAGQEQQPPLLKQFNGVYVMDSTVVGLPDELAAIWAGCNGSALKISVCWELLSGQLVSVYLHDGQEHDQRAPMQMMNLPRGALRLCDLGYFKLEVLKQQDGGGTAWVTRYKGGTTLSNANGDEIDLLAMLRQPGRDIIECDVYLGATQRIACRLVAQRIPEDKLKHRQEQLARWESRKQKTASPLRWSLLAWSIYLTNAAEEQLSAEAIMVMARLRWQIELLFRLWKHHIDIDDWRTQNPWRILCEVYAKLIACMLQHWVLLMGEAHDVTVSMPQASRTIQRYAWTLAGVIRQRSQLEYWLAHIRTVLKRMRPISYSASSLPTFQRIEQLSA